MSLLISGATLIDGVAPAPIEGQSILIEGGRIKAIGPAASIGAGSGARTIDARGKFVIPGLMNANVHLFCDFRLEILARHFGSYDEVIVEAAQVALKSGLTSVFDTWGPRAALMKARDSIDAGEALGSRIFCAGNIIGFDGPISPDFVAKAADVASPAFVKRINAVFVENVGRHLMWLTPEQVAREVRTYIQKGIDFAKYASNEHFGTSAGAFLAFSPRVQLAIVEEVHRAGLTAQAHASSVEGLLIAVEAGCDLIQHANYAGPAVIPDSLIELMAARKTGTVVFPHTQRRLDWVTKHQSHRTPNMWRAADTNARNFIRAGLFILLATDGVILSPDTLADPKFESTWGGPWEDSPYNLATSHFTWLIAMEEKGMKPMEALRAATLNIATAYGKERDLGSVEPGKFADLLVLDKDPLASAANYSGIHLVIKNGEVVDRDGLPANPVLTRPFPMTSEEEVYAVFESGNKPFPMCGCARH